MNHDNDNNPAIRFFSVCSGIEAASVAFGPLGWRAVGFAEIDKAASALLAYHYPDVPNYGDFTAVDITKLGRVDILCGGTPCQAFSVAGARGGLNDARGNLTLSFVDLAHALAENNGLRNVIWENVVGVLSDETNAFGCLLAGLVGADDAFPAPDGTRWPESGMVAGPRARAAWRVLDAQYFGLAQRRRRVILVADFGNGADPATVLFERASLRRDIAPRGEAGEGVAAFSASSIGSYRDAEVSGPVRAAGGDNGGGSENLALYGLELGNQGGGGNVGWFPAHGPSRTLDTGAPPGVAYAPEIARCDATREGTSQDYESTTMVAQQVYSMMPQNSGKDFKARPVDIAQPPSAAGPSHGNQGGDVVCVTGTVTHTLTTEGADASEDGTGRGTPIVAFQSKASATQSMNPAAIAPALDVGKGDGLVICFTAKDYGADAAVDIAPTLRAGGHKDSHQNGGVTPAVTVALRGRDGGATAEVGGSDATALRASSGGGDKPHVLYSPDVYPTLSANEGGTLTHIPPVVTSAVRRLTPRECERLQGFPDDYTRIPVRRFKAPKHTRLRPADMWECIDGEWWLMTADGPRYKQLGNSWAVPKFAWLGARIAKHMPANNKEQCIAAA